MHLLSQSFCCFYFCLVATIALCAGEDISYKEKLTSLIKEQYGGVAAFDDTISESMAKEEYLKYTNGEYSENGMKEEKRSLISSGALFDAADKELILEMHNNYRKALCSEDGTVDDISGNIYPACSNMNYLFWDDALEQVAQGWADSLASNCSGVPYNNARSSDLQTYSNDASFIVPSNAYVGEILGVFQTYQSISDISFATNFLETMWLQHKVWSYQAFGGGYAVDFIHMAWANTRYIGCAAASCQVSSTYRYFTVCNYYPGGASLGEYPYSCAGSDCTNCDSDRTRWHDSQCGGCMNTAYTSGGSGGSTDCNDGFNNVANNGVDISTTTTCDDVDSNGCDIIDPGCEETSTTFCCDDGCEISKQWYQDGIWCDCTNCEDENTCDCPTGGCSFICPSYEQCW